MRQSWLFSNPSMTMLTTKMVEARQFLIGAAQAVELEP
jgi:hypothetical protein